jgi:hypothetical protein
MAAQREGEANLPMGRINPLLGKIDPLPVRFDPLPGVHPDQCGGARWQQGDSESAGVHPTQRRLSYFAPYRYSRTVCGLNRWCRHRPRRNLPARACPAVERSPASATPPRPATDPASTPPEVSSLFPVA